MNQKNQISTLDFGIKSLFLAFILICISLNTNAKAACIVEADSIINKDSVVNDSIPIIDEKIVLKQNEVKKKYIELLSLKEQIVADSLAIIAADDSISKLNEKLADEEKRKIELDKDTIVFEESYKNEAVLLFCDMQLSRKYNENNVKLALNAFEQLDKNVQIENNMTKTSLEKYGEFSNDMKDVFDIIESTSSSATAKFTKNPDSSVYDNLRKILNKAKYAGFNDCRIPFLDFQLNRLRALLGKYEEKKILNSFNTIIEDF